MIIILHCITFPRKNYCRKQYLHSGFKIGDFVNTIRYNVAGIIEIAKYKLRLGLSGLDLDQRSAIQVIVACHFRRVSVME
jgi:hypothetical protein